MLSEISRAILQAETPHGESVALRTFRAGDAPSNQQIINAAQQAYSQHQPAVDAMTIALVNLISSGSQTTAITALDSVNWLSPGISDDVVAPFYADRGVQSAITVARRDSALNSFSVGAFSNALPDNQVGTIGFDRDMGSATTAGTMLTLDLYQNTVSTELGSNLQFGLWTKAPGALHDLVIGLYIATAVQGLPINLKLLLTPSLQPYGFVVSAGATVNLPVTTAVFAGQTATWS